MRLRNKKGIIIVVVVIICVVVLLRILFPKSSPSKLPKGQKIVPVEIAVVNDKGTIRESLDLTGEVEARNSVTIISKVTGRIDNLEILNERDEPNKDPDKKKVIEEGVKVKAGQGIAIIDHDAFIAQVKQAEASLQTAKINAQKDVIESRIAEVKAVMESALARQKESKTRLENLEKDFRRKESLWKSEDKVISDSEYDQALSNYKSAQENEHSAEADTVSATAAYTQIKAQAKELAEAQVAQARATLDLAKVQLRESIIRSPISGLISKQFVGEGNMVALNVPIVEVVDIENVKIVASIPERYLGQVNKGSTPVEISVDSYPGKTFTGVVDEVYPGADTKTRAFPIRIVIQNKDSLLRPGMFARIKLILKEKKDTIVIPRDVVLGHEQTELFVFVINNEKAKRQVVKLGLSEGPDAEVIEGLKAGEKLVVNGMNYLQDGTLVKIAEGEVAK